MNYFDEFYPTPLSVIEKMFEPYKKVYKHRETYGFNTWEEERVYYAINDRIILEPSAGKGDLLDFIKEHNSSKKNIYCIESNPELQLILRGKGYKLIDNDFLNYHGDYIFNFIIMNPPFSNGDEHLLKAWDILDEGDIICLLNAETIRNPYSKKRELLKHIIDENGSVEYLGNVFSDAERTTDIEIALIRLHKKSKTKKFDFEFKNVTNEEHLKFEENTIGNPVATRDIIGNMILQYNKLKEIYIEYNKIKAALSFYSKGLMSKDKGIFSVIEQCKGDTKIERYNEFCDGMKQEIWANVISQIGMERYMTSAVKKNFNQFTQEQGTLDFTKENVQSLINMLLENSSNILDQAIIDVFDLFTSYYKENRLIIDGWKTNNKYKVNQKVILPSWVKWGEYMSSYDKNKFADTFKTCYSKYDQYRDIDKALCYLTGKKYETIYKIHDSLENRFKELGNIGSASFDGTCESEFFDMLFYKKGTLHITFKDKRIWQEFNMRACNGKNWLPDSEKKEWEETKIKNLMLN